MPKQKQKQGAQLRRESTRDARVQARPVLQELGRQRKQARRETQQGIRGARQTYETLENTLEGLAPRFQEQSKDIRSNYVDDVGEIAGMFAGQTVGAPGEGNAGRHLAATMAGGGSQLLAAQAARNNAYNTSAIRRAGIEKKDQIGDYRQTLSDFLTDLKSQRMDVKQAMGPQIAQFMDEKRDRRTDIRLANHESDYRDRAMDLEEAQFNRTFKEGKRRFNDAEGDENKATKALGDEAARKKSLARGRYMDKHNEWWRVWNGGPGHPPVTGRGKGKGGAKRRHNSSGRNEFSSTGSGGARHRRK